MICTGGGHPAEIFFSPGSMNDAEGLKLFSFSLPENSTVCGDKAYSSYDFEDLLWETGKIRLMPIRKKNMKRQRPPCTEYLIRKARKYAETANSLITGMFPKSIHAVTPQDLKSGYFSLYLHIISVWLYNWQLGLKIRNENLITSRSD